MLTIARQQPAAAEVTDRVGQRFAGSADQIGQLLLRQTSLDQRAADCSYAEALGEIDQPRREPLADTLIGHRLQFPLCSL